VASETINFKRGFQTKKNEIRYHTVAIAFRSMRHRKHHSMCEKDKKQGKKGTFDSKTKLKGACDEPTAAE
jgi:hypothetical protein